jgi:hypothetical protein
VTDTVDATATPDPTATPSPTATPVGPDATGPAAFGLCTAYTHGGLSASSTAYKSLVVAAKGSTSTDIAAYCATVVAPGTAATHQPSNSATPSDAATAAPQHSSQPATGLSHKPSTAGRP